MQLFIGKDGGQLGPFSETEVRERLAAGYFSGAELAWHEGLADWKPLQQLLDGGVVAPPIPAAVVQARTPYTPPMTALPSQSLETKTSAAAIWSLVCGILGLVIGLTSLPAVIFGHVGLSRIKRSGGALTGRGMAIAGLVMGYLMVCVTALAILAAIAVPSFGLVQQQAFEMKAASNAKQILMGLSQYASDHNGSYPPALETLFEEDILTDRKVLECPIKSPEADKANGWEYLGAGHSSSDAADTIIVISREASRRGKLVVGHLDGSVETVKQDRLKQ